MNFVGFPKFCRPAFQIGPRFNQYLSLLLTDVSKRAGRKQHLRLEAWIAYGKRSNDPNVSMQHDSKAKWTKPGNVSSGSYGRLSMPAEDDIANPHYVIQDPPWCQHATQPFLPKKHGAKLWKSLQLWSRWCGEVGLQVQKQTNGIQLLNQCFQEITSLTNGLGVSEWDLYAKTGSLFRAQASTSKDIYISRSSADSSNTTCPGHNVASFWSRPCFEAMTNWKKNHSVVPMMRDFMPRQRPSTSPRGPTMEHSNRQNIISTLL